MRFVSFLGELMVVLFEKKKGMEVQKQWMENVGGLGASYSFAATILIVMLSTYKIIEISSLIYVTP